MAAKDIESAFNTVDMDKSGEISKRVSSHFSYVFRFSQMNNKQLRLLLKREWWLKLKLTFQFSGFLFTQSANKKLYVSFFLFDPSPIIVFPCQ